MRTLKEIIKIEANYLRGLGQLPTEGDWDFNKIQRAKIRAFKNENNGTCYLGKINYSNGELKEYKKGMVYNFEYDFALPTYDEYLIQLIKEYNNNEAHFNSNECLKKIGQISNRIKEVKGITFTWV